MTGETLMEVRDLAVEFRVKRSVTRAVDGVSFDWRKGEILGVVGESGCGKSTLARAMLSLVEPAAGEMALDGEGVNGKRNMDELRRRLQMIFQDPYQTLNPRQRVRTIVAEPLRVQGVAKGEHEERVRRALEDVGLDQERFGERYPHQLSGGQRQRVAIAAALVLEPDGLICDEPVSMLDASVQAQILAVLLELQRRRELALLFITHDLSLAWTLCDRIVVMYLGRVVEQGTAVDVIERPQHPYTQALVSAIPVPTPGGGGQRELLSGELPGRHRRAPAAVASTRAARSASSPATRSIHRCSAPAGATSSPPACCTTRPWAAEASTRRAMAERALARHRRRRSGGSSPGRGTRSPTSRACCVGHSQSESGEPTGVTVVAPPALPAPAGTAVVNGMGELTGKIEIDERGTMETPVYLCGTHAVGIVHHAAVLASGRGPEDFVLPVVGECDDCWRADSRRVTTGDVDRALAALGTDVAEGSVGAGTGMMCFDYPGGIGTASRAVGDHHVGVLLLCNFGDRERPRPARDHGSSRRRAGVAPAGSCISVCATDAPLGPHELRRLALRPLLGLARVGSYGADGSGEIGLAFSTTDAGGAGRRATSIPTSPPPGRPRTRPSTTASSRPSPRELRDGTMQEPFPIELVRELARARDARR